MSGAMQWPGSTQTPQMNDPNELLNRVRHIDETTSQIFHWVRLGVVVLIVLVLVSILI
jgi:hypothetical protein